jgi:hypothetical protein
MRPLGLLILLAAFPAAALPAAGPALPDTLAEVGHYSPRPEGSTAEADLLSLVQVRLRSEGLAPTTFDFSSADFAHSFSRCLRVDIPGTSRDTLIVAVPLDTPAGAIPGADGSINVALALDLVSRVAGTTPPLSLTVLFLGAELGDTAAGYPLGSTLFLRDFRPDFRTAVLYLDLRDPSARVVVKPGGRGIVTPSWLVERCVQSLERAGLPFDLPGDQAQLFRMGATDERTLIEPYLLAGYPAVGLESAAGSLPGPGLSPGAGSPLGADVARLGSLGAFLDAFVAAGAAGVPDGWDRHYVLLQAAGASLVIDEQAYVIILFTVLVAAFLYALVFVRRLRKYLRTLFRNALAIVPLALLSFLFLAAGTYALQAILVIRGFVREWTYDPFAFLALKACVALFLYGVLYNLFRRFPIPRNGSFYSAAALLFLLVDIIAVAAINISFTWYFLWAFVFVFFSALAPNRYAKFALFLPAPFWGIRGVLAVFRAPALPFVRFLLLSPVWGNLLIAGACLPFVLVLLRLGLVFPGRGIFRRRRRELVIAGLMMSAGAALAVHLLTFSPFSPASPQPVTATQTIEVGASGETTSTSLAVESPAPLGTLIVSGASGSTSFPATQTTAFLPLPAIPVPVSVLVDSRQFLQQRNITLRLSMPRSPRSLAVSLTSDDDFILIDSSFPSVRESPREYRLLVGAFAPNPVPLELSLPTGGVFLLTLTMEFDEPLIGISLSTRPDLVVTPRVRVVQRLEIRT